jgi:hypothetical protein
MTGTILKGSNFESKGEYVEMGGGEKNLWEGGQVNRVK